MDLSFLNNTVERLRKDSIGDPVWNGFENKFEYEEQTVEVAVVLKLIRASHGVHSMSLLCEHGLFVDMGTIYTRSSAGS